MKRRPYVSRQSRRFNPDRLPAPIIYYQKIFPQLPVKSRSGWVSVHCCFHEDTRPSLRVNLNFGGFCCFGCGEKGDDIVAFHQKRHELSFVEAINYFAAWEYDDAE